jgi:hypothetical protein
MNDVATARHYGTRILELAAQRFESVIDGQRDMRGWIIVALVGAQMWLSVNPKSKLLLSLDKQQNALRRIDAGEDHSAQNGDDLLTTDAWRQGLDQVIAMLAEDSQINPAWLAPLHEWSGALGLLSRSNKHSVLKRRNRGKSVAAIGLGEKFLRWKVLLTSDELIAVGKTRKDADYECCKALNDVLKEFPVDRRWEGMENHKDQGPAQRNAKASLNSEVRPTIHPRHP